MAAPDAVPDAIAGSDATEPRRSPRAQPLAAQLLLAMAACAVLVIATTAVRLYLNYGWWYAWWLARSPPAPRACAVPSRARRDKPSPKIGILALRDRSPPLSRFEQLAAFASKAMANKQAYATYHGYELVVADAAPDSLRPAPWSKLTALRAALPRFDWILYVDGDALFVNPEPSLECFVDDDFDVVLASDWGGYNTGVFFVKNSSFADRLLSDMWAAGRYLAKPNSWWSHPLPFEFEQRALHFLADTPTWRHKASKYPGQVPTVDPSRALAVRARIKVLPQCALNSYLVRPSLLADDAAHRAARYAPGDFIVHLAGHKAANKAALFDFALTSLVVPPRGAPTRANCDRGSDGSLSSPNTTRPKTDPK